ncbi:hypothetical protein CRG98_031407 [Punica granatum]|uniref:Uncharacterized protein n=1 Tax=Punica granatum TaxID=22663 RepID=A0A2I0IVW5_PUNGR|nr:hypothetical protein CRG98_031407 [Punica granatum]
MQVLYSDFQDKPEKDLQMLMIQSLNLAMANSSEAIGYASSMAKNTPAALKTVVQSCSISFHGSRLEHSLQNRQRVFGWPTSLS